MEQKLTDKYKISDIGPCRKKMDFWFSVEEVASALDDSYKQVDQYVQIKGFRKGKAPRRMLEKKFAREAGLTAEEKLQEDSILPSIKKENISLLGQVKVTTPSGTLEAGEPYSFSVEFDVRPDFEMPQYKGLDLKEQPIAVSEEQVAAGLERFRKMFASYDDVDGAAELGDILEVDFRGAVEGKEIINMKDQKLRVEGDTLFGLPYPDLEAKFKGAKAGDKVELTITLPEDHPDIDLMGKDAQIEIDVKKVQRPNYPEMTDEFAANLGMNSISAFRDRIRNNLMNEAIMAARNDKEKQIIDTLIAATSFPVPQDIVEDEAQAIINSRRLEMLRNGMPEDRVDGALAAAKTEMEDMALRRVRWEIISSRIVEQENIQVSQAEIQNHVEALAKTYNTTPAKLIQSAKEYNGVAAMIKEILDFKVMQFIIDNSQSAEASTKRAEEIENSNAAAADIAAIGKETEAKAEDGEKEGE